MSDKLPGWTENIKQTQTINIAHLRLDEMSPIRSRPRNTLKNVNPKTLKIARTEEHKKLRAQSNYSPAKYLASRLSHNNFEGTIELPSFIIHETDLDLA